jgi:hypothetical protein
MPDSTIASLKNRMHSIRNFFLSSWAILHERSRDVLWHYTNAAGLLGILESNQLWFTDASFMNDASEMSYAVELTKQIVGERLEKETTHVIQEYFEAIVNALMSQRDNRRTFGIFSPAFVCSFCEEPDSLHLWRAYTNLGRGYSIGLFPDVIFQKLNPISILKRTIVTNKLIDSWEHYQPFLLRTIYEESEQRRVIDELLDSLAAAIVAAPEEFPTGNVNNHHRWIVVIEITRLFYLCLLCFKHPTFYDEKEWRFVYAPFVDPMPDSSTVSILKIYYRPRGNYFVPYLKVDVGEEKEVRDSEDNVVNVTTLPFEDIIAGPGLDIRLARAAFNAFALRSGYAGSNVGVTESTVPLRSL